MIKKLISAFVLTIACSAAWANPLSTKTAFDALFSMTAEQQPEGFATSPPEGFIGESADESELINFLSMQRIQGADFNAYRHQGTLLHHAIRSGLNETVIWLLKHGANPMLRLETEQEGFDAMGIAIHTNAWNVVDILRQSPAYSRISATEVARFYWPIAFNSGKKSVTNMRNRFGLPHLQHNPEIVRSLLVTGLCNADISLVQELLNNEPALATQHGLDRSIETCPALNNENKLNTDISFNEWKNAENSLQWPIMSYLMSQVKSKAQMDALLHSDLRQPWTHLQVLRQAMLNAMRAEQAAALTFFKAIPSAELNLALQNDYLLDRWLPLAADLPLPDLVWALQQIDSKNLTAVLPKIIELWDNAAATSRNAKSLADRVRRWTLLARQLTPPLPKGGNPFPYVVPIDTWPIWFTLGYTLDDEIWANWIRGVAPAQLQQAWPTITKFFPKVANRSLTWLVAPLSVGSIEDPIARLLSYGTVGSYWYHDNLLKAVFLYDLGLRVEPPRWLATEFATSEWLKENDLLVSRGLVKLPPSTQRKQLEAVNSPPPCKPIVSAALRRALAPHAPLQTADADALKIEWAEAIQIPGMEECAWLGGGGSSGGRLFIDEEDFFEGTWRLTPCTDGNFQAAMWDEISGHWLKIPATAAGTMIPIRSKQNQEMAYVFSEVGLGGCGTQSGELYRPTQTDDGKPTLVALNPGDPLHDALALQCSFKAISECFNISDEMYNEGNSNSIQTYLSDDKKTFFAALDRLDRKALHKASEAGLFPQWLNEAVKRINENSTWSLLEKRKRMAWLLAQHHLLLGLNEETLQGLLIWLPAEDWGPIIDAQRCSNSYMLSNIAEESKAQKNPALYRRLEKALAQPCKKI